MQIKKKLRINVALSAVMALVFCLLFGFSLYRINKANNLAKIAGDITLNSLERVTFRNDYLWNNSARAKEQWFAKHEQIGNILSSASVDFRDVEDRRNIDEMIKHHESIGNIFLSIVANREKGVSTPTSAALSREVEDRFINQMNMVIYEVVIHNRQLLETSRKTRASVITQAGGSIVILLAVAIALGFINSGALGRTITERVRRLRDGAAVIGSGNLDHRIEVEGDDELSELSEAFNVMTAKLSDSYLDLEKEIKERKQAEQALRASEEIYRAIGESIDYGIWICKADGSNIYASDSFLQMVGLTQEQCSSFGWGNVLHPDDAERTIAAWKECVRTGGTWDIEHRFKGIDGEWHPVLARGVPVRDEKGAIQYWAGINLDISRLKLAEQTLRENEERLRFHAENSPMATIEWNADFTVTRWAGEAENIFGWSAAETVGKPIMDLRIIYEEDLPAVEATMEKLTSGKTRHVISSNRNYTKNGKVIRCEWYNTALLDSQGKMSSVMSQVLDVTERNRAEEALTVSEARYRRLFESSKDGILILDAETGKIVDVNPFLIELLGYSLGEFIEKEIWDLGFFKDIVANKSRFLELQQYEYVRYEDLPLETNSGRQIHVEFVSNVYLVNHRKVIQCNIRDISKRKQAEYALQHSLTRFELLAYSARELLLSRDPRKIVEAICGRMLEHLDCHAYFNFLVDEQAGRLRLNAYAGIPAEEAEKIEWLDYGVAVCGCAARDGHRIVAEHIPGTPDERTVLVKSYGIKAYACHPLAGADGKVIGTLSFGTRSRETFSEDDLSLMKAVADQVSVAMIRMENTRKMQQTNVQLEAINKELEAFIYSVSHDLRAPLRSITGFAQFIIDDYYDKLEDKCRDYLGRIMRGTERMSRLIDDLVDLSRISRQEMRNTMVNLSGMAHEIISAFREENPHRNVQVDIAEGLIVSGDSRLIRLVLSNLLGNSWKFTSRTENGRIEFGALNQEGKTIFYVRDNGVGFDSDYKSKMFLPFQRLHSEGEFEGTGIGLTIVERIVHRHGGVVWAEGESGKGAAIFFTLGSGTIYL